MARKTPIKARITVSGEAKNAKGGAIVMVGDGVPIYVVGLDRWPPDKRDTPIRVEGMLLQKRHLPEAETLPSGIITQGVEPGGEGQWVIEDHTIVARGGAPGALPVDFFKAAWPEHASCLAAIEASLGADAFVDFHIDASVRTRGGDKVFGLWHRDAFLPQNIHMTGNPGGKCRDAVCDPASGTVKQFLFWQ